MGDGYGVMVELGGLWWSRTRDGRAYLSGRLGEARLVILPNRGKVEGDRRPDFRMFVVSPVGRAEGPASGVPADGWPDH